MDVIERELLRTALRFEFNRKMKDLSRIQSNLEDLKRRIEKQLEEIKHKHSTSTESTTWRERSHREG